MKDFLEFLMLYPLWVKLTIIGAFALCVLLLVLFKPESAPKTAQLPQSSTNISVGTNKSGQVAGRDIINHGPVGADPSELIRILQIRAQQIKRDLASHFKYTDVREFLQDFERLHGLHIAALERQNLTEAHECLSMIHSLSEKLQSSEFWARHRAETPHTHYSLDDTAFQRGRLITSYAGDEAAKLLIKRPSIALEEELLRLTGNEGRAQPGAVAPHQVYAAIS